MSYDNTNSGFIGKNDRKEPGSKQPDIRGSINVDGTEYWLDGWKNSKGYGLKVKPKEAKPEAARGSSRAAPDPDPFNDDSGIPF